MHISDGVLTTPVTVGAYAVSLGILAWSSRRLRGEDLPKLAVVTSAFFVASLVHVPFGPTSVHLLLPGLVGILLGSSAFITIALGIVLQSLLFQFGGITAIGANSIMMGIPALLAGGLYHLGQGPSLTRKVAAAVIAGALAVVLAALILALLLASAGEDFMGVAKLALYAHTPVVLIEGAVSGFAVSFLSKVKPELIETSLGSRLSP